MPEYGIRNEFIFDRIGCEMIFSPKTDLFDDKMGHVIFEQICLFSPINMASYDNVNWFSRETMHVTKMKMREQRLFAILRCGVIITMGK